MKDMQETGVVSVAETELFEAGRSFDESRTEMIERSERRAWRVAAGGALVGALACAAVVVMAAKQTVEPHIYVEDASSGVVNRITRLVDVDLSGNEVRDRYWVGMFVRACETYEWGSLDGDFHTCGLLSGESVFREIEARYIGENALQTRWAESVRARVHVKTRVHTAPEVMAVRFSKTIQSARRGSEPEVTHWIATIGFKYDTSLRMSEADRDINPWGFQVISYRVDPELQGGNS